MFQQLVSGAGPAGGGWVTQLRDQRNADFATQTLLGTDNTSPVDISIDPFFVRYTPPRVVSTELS